MVRPTNYYSGVCRLLSSGLAARDCFGDADRPSTRLLVTASECSGAPAEPVHNGSRPPRDDGVRRYSKKE
eukprot:scaffold190_cov171-Amphora_coffeaeformis.AAC.28